MVNRSIKPELLKLLTPSSPKLELSGKTHDSISTEDINALLGFSKLTNLEYAILVHKYINENLNDDFYRSLKTHVLKDLKQNTKFKLDNEIKLDDLLHLAIIELTVTKCWVCKGTGFLIHLNSLSKCPHCDNGDYIYNDVVRTAILKIKRNEYYKINKLYKYILDFVTEIEYSALSKIS